MTLRIAAEHADIWHGFGDAETMARKNQVLDDWCRTMDREPSMIERACDVGPRDQPLGDGYLAAGINQLTIEMDGGRFDADSIRRWVAWRDERNMDRA